jgi:hypothetical protein
VVSDDKLELARNAGLFPTDFELTGDCSEKELLPEAPLVKRANCLPADSTCFAALFINAVGILVTIWKA